MKTVGATIDMWHHKTREALQCSYLTLQSGKYAHYSHSQFKRDINNLNNYWLRQEQYCTPFHILRFLHFENNDETPNYDKPDYDRLWKIRFLTQWEQISWNIQSNRTSWRQWSCTKWEWFFSNLFQRFWHQTLQALWLGFTYERSVYLGKHQQHTKAKIIVKY